jgi:hypothetical protein
MNICAVAKITTFIFFQINEYEFSFCRALSSKNCIDTKINHTPVHHPGRHGPKNAICVFFYIYLVKLKKEIDS